jgi:hypothetical protein
VMTKAQYFPTSGSLETPNSPRVNAPVIAALTSKKERTSHGVHLRDDIFQVLDVVGLEHLDQSAKAFQADRSNLIGHNVVSFAIADYSKPERPAGSEFGCHQTNHRHLRLMHRLWANHHKGTALLLFVSFAWRV